MNQASNLRGIAFMLASAGTFVLNDNFMKLALAHLPPYEVLFLRGLSGSLCALVILAVMGDLPKLKHATSKWVYVRGTLELGAILTYILALVHATVGNVTAIFQITPLLVILGMVFIHREAASGLRLFLVGLGFAGALLVAQPGSGATSPYLLLAFITTIFAALRDLAGRKIPSQISALAAALITILMVLIAAALIGLITENWVWPSYIEALLVAGAGLLMMLGHMFTFLAYRHASAQAVAPFYYAFMVWAVVLGFLIFGDVPNHLAILGMALILASGVAIAVLERRPENDAQASAEA
jgi:drug/metabolite transporter (DMT)-like permease